VWAVLLRVVNGFWILSLAELDDISEANQFLSVDCPDAKNANPDEFIHYTYGSADQTRYFLRLNEQRGKLRLDCLGLGHEPQSRGSCKKIEGNWKAIFKGLSFRQDSSSSFV